MIKEKQNDSSFGVCVCTDKVDIEEWNEQEDEYAFVYINPEKDSEKVLVKCLVILFILFLKK